MTRQELKEAQKKQSGLFAVPIVKQMAEELDSLWKFLDKMNKHINVIDKLIDESEKEFERMTGVKK